ncbi:hypothetical protein V8D89_003557 [Ganoderma adspersum]
MSAAKKTSAAKSAGTRKSAPRAAPTHPSWVDMIKECIAAHPEDARSGVSRPQIKKFVEDNYKLDIGNAQITQLSKAITSGAEKGVFVLPKGPSGRVKLPPKTTRPAEGTAAKENKPDSKSAKAPAKAKPASKATTSKTTAAKKTGAVKKPGAKSAAAPKKAAPAKSTATKAKAPAKKAETPKKAPAKKAAAPKKASTASKRDSAKKAATGRAPAAKKTPARASGTKSRGARATKK